MQQLLPRATFQRRYVVPPWRSMSGLGDAASDAAAAQQVGSIATPAVTGIIAGHAASVAAATGAAHATIFGVGASTMVPIIGAALVGVTLLAAWLIKNSGCGQTCVVTSQWANKAEDMLKQNIAAYFALPAPRPRSAQTVALANFDAVWETLKEQCGQSQMGDAGKRCISDRQAGACQWKQTTDSPLLAYPGEPQPGSCWNWFSGYRDPIANDPNVTDSTAAGSTTGTFADMGVGTALAQVQTALGGVSPILLIGGALLAIGILGGKK